jgi:hypothetical protein
MRSYQEALERYRLDDKQYSDALENYTRAKEILSTPQGITQHRIHALRSLLSHAPAPVQPKEQSNRGVGEEFFLNCLEARFRGKISFNVGFPLDEDTMYYPDFVYHDARINLFIDIEIDEPYISYTGEPIHYVDSRDELRNWRFCDEGWVVIRFAEEQIFRYPELCCDLIQHVADSISTSRETNLSKYSLPKVSQWTRDEAHKMAFLRYRHTYIPNKELHYMLT